MGVQQLAIIQKMRKGVWNAEPPQWVWMWGLWILTQRPLALTVHGQCDAALSREGVVCDGDLNIVRAVVKEPQVVEEQGTIFKHQDPVSVLGPQSPDDVGSNGLNHGDGLLSPQLPLDDWQVGAEAAVVNWEQSFPAHRCSDQRVGDGHIHCQDAPYRRHTPGKCSLGTNLF